MGDGDRVGRDGGNRGGVCRPLDARDAPAAALAAGPVPDVAAEGEPARVVRREDADVVGAVIDAGRVALGVDADVGDEDGAAVVEL